MAFEWVSEHLRDEDAEPVKGNVSDDHIAEERLAINMDIDELKSRLAQAREANDKTAEAHLASQLERQLDEEAQLRKRLH